MGLAVAVSLSTACAPRITGPADYRILDHYAEAVQRCDRLGNEVDQVYASAVTSRVASAPPELVYGDSAEGVALRAEVGRQLISASNASPAMQCVQQAMAVDAGAYRDWASEELPGSYPPELPLLDVNECAVYVWQRNSYSAHHQSELNFVVRYGLGASGNETSDTALGAQGWYPQVLGVFQEIEGRALGFDSIEALLGRLNHARRGEHPMNINRFTGSRTYYLADDDPRGELWHIWPMGPQNVSAEGVGENPFRTVARHRRGYGSNTLWEASLGCYSQIRLAAMQQRWLQFLVRGRIENLTVPRLVANANVESRRGPALRECEAAASIDACRAAGAVAYWLRSAEFADEADAVEQIISTAEPTIGRMRAEEETTRRVQAAADMARRQETARADAAADAAAAAVAQGRANAARAAAHTVCMEACSQRSDSATCERVCSHTH